MLETQSLPVSVLEAVQAVDRAAAEQRYRAAVAAFKRKIVVLDDDPTGVQTVHGVSVYTDWEKDTIRQGLEEQNSIFFLMTNSRGFTKERTAAVHREIAERLVCAAREAGTDYLLVSRSDSTLRGHYPLETQVLCQELSRLEGKNFSGEIVVPFFPEGGRFTIDNVHYVREGDRLLPAAQTEFARDKSFPFSSSHLGDWCEEKTGGAYRADQMIYISQNMLRDLDYAGIQRCLEEANDFDKIIVNATDYIDLKIFATSLLAAIAGGREYILRSAAAMTKVLGGIPDRPLLSRRELVSPDNHNGGVVIVGSHVNKTTRQLEELRNTRHGMEFIEFDQHLIEQEGGLTGEVERVVGLINQLVPAGRSVAVYTRREHFSPPSQDKDEMLRVSLRISEAVTSVIAKLKVRPSFIIAKGGITASDVGTKALKVRRATVMGQIKPGIPVWMTGEESKFPHMPYIIFPGNVGEVQTLREIVDILMK